MIRAGWLLGIWSPGLKFITKYFHLNKRVSASSILLIICILTGAYLSIQGNNDWTQHRTGLKMAISRKYEYQKIIIFLLRSPRFSLIGSISISLQWSWLAQGDRYFEHYGYGVRGTDCILIATYRLLPIMIHHQPAPSSLLFTFMWSQAPGRFRKHVTVYLMDLDSEALSLVQFNCFKARFKVPIRPIFSWTEPLLGCLNLIVLLSASALGP